jgi:hypothetical protein
MPVRSWDSAVVSDGLNRLPKNLIALVLYQGHDFHRSLKKSLSDWFVPGQL